jgi:putative peptide zinc metalloprotease protein
MTARSANWISIPGDIHVNADYCTYPPSIAGDVEVTEDGDGDRPAYIVGAATVGRYLILRATEYSVLRLLSQSRAPGEICNEFKRRYGATLALPTLAKFLARLDDVGILAGQRAQRTEAWGQQLSGSPYFRVNLFNPDRLFTWMVSGLRWIWTKEFLISTLLLMFVALGLALINRDELISCSGQVLREHFIAILIAGLFVGLSHEFAHGLTCKAFGGRATEVGALLIYYFLPALYCNVSGIHLIRQRHRRLWVIAAGIYWQLLVGTAALLAWLAFVPQTLLATLALIIFLGSVLDLLINANPLIKLDGYYFLSQWLRLPNLMDRSRAYWRGLWRGAISGEPDEAAARHTRRERVVYAVFGLLSSLYIVALLGAIVLFVGGYLVDSFYFLGLPLTAGIAVWYLRRPLKQVLSVSVKWMKKIWEGKDQPDEPGLMNGEQRRFRGFLSSFKLRPSSLLRWRRAVPAALLVLVVGILLMPWTASVGNYGMLSVIPGQEAIIRAPESATLIELRVRPGEVLAGGAAVGRLNSVELEDQTAEIRSDLARATTEHNRVEGELRAHKESAARAEVQWRQRQHEYDELTAEQKQIQAKSSGTVVLDRLPTSKDQGLLRSPRDGLHHSRLAESPLGTPVPWPASGTNSPAGRDAGARSAWRVRTNFPAAIAVLEADVNLCQARLEEANRQLERERQLSAHGVAPRHELETAETRSATLIIELGAARQRLEAALINHRRKHTSASTDMLLAHSDFQGEQLQNEKLDGELRAMRTLIETLEQRLHLLQRRQAKFELITPRAGAVFGEELPRQVGQHFTKGAEICRVAETHQLLARIQVPEAEIGDVRLGHPVRLKARAFPDQIFRGVVSKIGGESEPDEHRRKTYRVELTIENSAGLLRPGMTAFARIDFDRRVIGQILLHKLKQAIRPELWML